MKPSNAKLNTAIIVLTALLGAGYILHLYLPNVAGTWIKTAAYIIVPYLIAAILIRVTVKRVTSLLGERVAVEHQLLLSKAYNGAIYTIATLAALYQFGVELENLTLVVGLLTTALALAIRDIIASYLTWYILLTKQPFKIGDFIKIGDEQGLVEHIGTFHVVLDDSPERREDFIRIPNKVFLEKPIYNYGKSVPISLKVPIDGKKYDSKKDKVSSEIKKRCGSPVKLWLESDHLGVYARAECQTTFEKRASVKDSILAVISRDMGK